MTTDDKKQGQPIDVPTSNKTRERVRAIAEAGASLIPGGGAVARVLRITNPPKSEQDRKDWQKAISERTNEHSERLDDHERLLAPTRTLTGVTAHLIAALAWNCPDGLGSKRYELADLCDLLPDTERQAIEDAVFDLEHYGLMQLSRTLGRHWWARLTSRFYEQVDEQLMGWNAGQDAITLAGLMLEADEGRAAQLHEASGWSRRRFNPAFHAMLDHFPPGRVSQEIQPDYAAPSVVLLPEDRSRLRRIMKAEL